jgi:excisionase family DNA binding protein
MNNPFALIDARLSNIESLLLDIKHAKHNDKHQIQLDQWLNLKEALLYLPGKPSSATVYKWVKDGTIPAHKVGKQLRFLKSEIDNWLKQGEKGIHPIHISIKQKE